MKFLEMKVDQYKRELRHLGWNRPLARRRFDLRDVPEDAVRKMIESLTERYAASLTFQINTSVQPAGFTSQVTTTVNANALVSVNNSAILAAQPATLTTRSGNTTGTLTMTNSSHGIVTGQRVDLYWTNNTGLARGVTVGSVSGTSVPISGGTYTGGTLTVLPSATSAINVGIPASQYLQLIGSNVQGIALYNAATSSGMFSFEDASASNDVQTLTITGGPTGGTFTLTFNAQTTATIAYNALASAVQTALQALSTIGTNNCTVTGPAGGPWVVTFVGTMALLSQNVITLGTNSLSGGSSPSVSIAHTVTGGATEDWYQALLTSGNYTWWTGNGVVNPLANYDIGQIWMSHGYTGGVGTLQALVLTN